MVRDLTKMPSPRPPAVLFTCACNKEKDPVKAGFRVRTSWAKVRFMDNVCEGCESVWRDYATVICTVCKTPVARISPHKDPCGFVFKKGGVYHTEGCGICLPESKTSVVVELAYYRDRKTR